MTVVVGIRPESHCGVLDNVAYPVSNAATKPSPCLNRHSTKKGVRVAYHSNLTTVQNGTAADGLACYGVTVTSTIRV